METAVASAAPRYAVVRKRDIGTCTVVLVRESTNQRLMEPRRLVLMNARNKRRWSDLCGEAEVEEDLEKLQKLAEQITHILDDEQARLKSLHIKAKRESLRA